jgi:crossover junction endodeoxyribonuclease RuvC
MRVLGLDPGFERLGFGVVDTEPEFKVANLGVIPYVWDHTRSWNENLNSGIENITEQFPRLLMLYDPKEIAAEIVPAGKLGSKSELVTASITVCKTLAFLYGIPWNDYGANTVKLTVAGEGNATKAQVRNAILRSFPEWEPKHKAEKMKQKKDGMKRPPGIPQDAFDGAAIAVTHLVKENNELQWPVFHSNKSSES